ncbi:GNAT family N-acetyltransferase [Paracoccaceae bacterium Fryx2]|nr:GNAT family N-acetyltransferase [Paracoccaceae bacterium Fryx2]
MTPATPYRAQAPQDWGAVLRLIQIAFAGMEGRIDPPSSMHHLTVADIARQAEEAEVWLIGAKPVACVFLTPKPGMLHIGKLAVDAAHRGQGLARALIATAEARARALGLPLLELQSRVELLENHATFAALGFRQTGATAHPGYLRPTSLTFARPV